MARSALRRKERKQGAPATLPDGGGKVRGRP